MRPREIDWMYGGGCGMLRPLAWRSFLSHLPPGERHDPLLGYYVRLLSEDTHVRDAAVRRRAVRGCGGALVVRPLQIASWTCRSLPGTFPPPVPLCVRGTVEQVPCHISLTVALCLAHLPVRIPGFHSGQIPTSKLASVRVRFCWASVAALWPVSLRQECHEPRFITHQCTATHNAHTHACVTRGAVDDAST